MKQENKTKFNIILDPDTETHDFVLGLEDHRNQKKEICQEEHTEKVDLDQDREVEKIIQEQDLDLGPNIHLKDQSLVLYLLIHIEEGPDIRLLNHIEEGQDIR